MKADACFCVYICVSEPPQNVCTSINTCSTQTNKQKNQRLGDFWDTTKTTKIHIMGIPEGEKRENGRKNMWRNDGRKLPKFDEWHESAHQEAQRIQVK